MSSTRFFSFSPTFGLCSPEPQIGSNYKVSRRRALLRSQLCHLLALWPQISHLTSLSHSFFSVKSVLVCYCCVTDKHEQHPFVNHSSIGWKSGGLSWAFRVPGIPCTKSSHLPGRTLLWSFIKESSSPQLRVVGRRRFFVVVRTKVCVSLLVVGRETLSSFRLPTFLPMRVTCPHRQASEHVQSLHPLCISSLSLHILPAARERSACKSSCDSIGPTPITQDSVSPLANS